MLTNTQLKKLKAKDKPIKKYDGGGLFILVSPAGPKSPSGKKWWRFKYRFNGIGKLLALGTYPEVDLAQARAKRDEARKLVAAGVDPSKIKKAQKLAKGNQSSNSFEVVSREWHKKFSNRWKESHKNTIIQRLEKDIFPWIGRNPVNEISAPELLSVLRRIEARGALDNANRVRNTCAQIYSYAIATGRAESNPAAHLRGALSIPKFGHFAAPTNPVEVGKLLSSIDGYEGSLVTKSAMRLLPLVFTRPGELRHMEWAEIDFEKALWCIPEGKMKMKLPHIVPLARQSLEILNEIRPMTGFNKYVFPSERSVRRAMSNNTINAGLRRLGYSRVFITGHGFRAIFRTLGSEILHINIEYLEQQLSHAVRDSLGRAYNRTTHLPERISMMQQWADYLDSIKNEAVRIETIGK